MKVFISWSGEPSRSIARALTDWLESVVQHVDAWMSDEEIGSGARWNDVIAKALDDTDFGICCVTRSNQHAPWLMFESGALAKRLVVAKVVPLCIDLRPSDVTGPLAAFQGRQLDESGVRRLVHDISAVSEKPMPSERLDEVFDAMWSKLETAFTEAIDRAPASQEPHRSPEDMLGELVDRVRRIDRAVLSSAPHDIEWFRTWLADAPRGSQTMLLLSLLNELLLDESDAVIDELQEELRKTAAFEAFRRELRRTAEEVAEAESHPLEDDTEQNDEDGVSSA